MKPCVVRATLLVSPERSHMRAFSAADSVSLAIQRTREFLFTPFRWGTYLKLGLVAIITEGSWTNLRSSSNGGSHLRARAAP